MIVRRLMRHTLRSVSPDFVQRFRNVGTRLVHGLPRGSVFPESPTDLYQAILSVYDFFASFVVGKKVLDATAGTGFGATHLSAQGAADVVAVAKEKAKAMYARARSPSNVHIVTELPQSADFDVVVCSDGSELEKGSGIAFDELARRLRDGGVLLVASPPHLSVANQLGARLRARFATVKRFVHLASKRAPNLASRAVSELGPEDFRFVETPIDWHVPPALTDVFLATNQVVNEIRLHIGCGLVKHEGWINIDNQAYPTVDVRWDVARGIPFSDARFIYAEHFIEHLTYDQGLAFLRECRRVLRDDGVLRVSTPNLDWVWLNSYHLGTPDESLAVWDCLAVNRALRCWGHQFAYNAAMLTTILRQAGFERVAFARYGESGHPELRNLERHEQYLDTPEFPHILVAESSGRAEPVASYDELLTAYRRDLILR